MDLKTKLEARIRSAEKTIASKQATIARAKADLADLASAEGRLSRQREKKNKKPGEVPAAAPVPPAQTDPEVKKSKFTFF